MKHEIEFPDEYEVSRTFSAKGTIDNPIIEVHLKKKQIKNFDWYIDKYLREDPFTTKDEISNHLFTEDIKEIKTKLRSGDYRWVPWEIKIGLFRFICDDFKYDLHTYLTYSNRFITETFMFIPKEFVDDLFKTKTN